MKKIVFIMLGVFVFLTSIYSALAEEVVINVTGPVIVSPPTVTMSLSDWTIIYHTNNNPSHMRNNLAPGYEYQFAGEIIHLVAIVNSNSVFAPSSVQAVFSCPGGTYIQDLVLTNPPSTYPYQSTWESDYIIPDSVSGVCNVSVRMSYNSYTTIDYLNDNKYISVNEVLMNPQVTMTLTPFNFPNVIPNQLNPANPYPTLLSISTPVDAEGQGTLGNITLFMNRFCGVTQPSVCFGSENVRVSKTGGIGDWQWLTPDVGTYSKVFLGDITTNPLYNMNLWFQLFMPGNVPPIEYQSNDLIVLYQIL